jgi:hypothetical protein
MVFAWISRALASMLMALALLLPGYTLAATDQTANPTGSLSLVTSPLPLSLVAKPGTTVSTDLRIQNIGPTTEHLKVTVMKFGAEGENGTPSLLHPGPSDDFIKWASFSQTQFNAEPNTWKTIKMTVTLPKSAAFGYYYAVVFSRANEATVENKANLKGAIATLVLLEAKVPQAKRSVQVLEFTSAHNLYEFLPATFNVRVKNTGNVHVAPLGNIFIKRGKKTISILNVNMNGGSILPGTNRAFSAKWNDAYPKYIPKEEDGKAVLNKKNQPEHKLDLGNFDVTKVRIGRYTAHMVLAYNDGTRDIPIEGTVTFWVIPWRAIILAIVMVALLEYLKIVRKTGTLILKVLRIKK